MAACCVVYELRLAYTFGESRANQYRNRRRLDEAGDAGFGREDQAGSGRTRPQDAGCAQAPGNDPPLSWQAPLGRRPRRNAAQSLRKPVILVDSSVWIDYFNGLATPQTSLLD